MNADERLWQINAKIEHARMHRDAVKKIIDEYVASEPYKLNVRRDDRTHRPIYFLEAISPPPLALSLTIGDSIHNLRTALEHLAFHLVWAHQRSKPSKGISFPIAEDHGEYKKMRKYLKDASPNAQIAVDNLKPFKGGDELLWQLHRLDIVDKHRLLLTAGSAFEAVDIGLGLSSGMFNRLTEMQSELLNIPLFIRPADCLFPLQPGAVLFTDLPNAEIGKKKFRFTVAVGEIGVAYGNSVLDLLDALLARVSEIVNLMRPHLV